MTKTISLRVTSEYDRSIRILAAMLDMNRSDFIREALEKRSTEVARGLGVNFVDVSEKAIEGHPERGIELKQISKSGASHD